jgi:hypothetical protein
LLRGHADGPVIPQAKSVVCGTLTGAAEAVVIAPFELVKVRLQAPERKHLYANTGDAFRKIARAEVSHAYCCFIVCIFLTLYSMRAILLCGVA